MVLLSSLLKAHVNTSKRHKDRSAVKNRAVRNGQRCPCIFGTRKEVGGVETGERKPYLMLADVIKQHSTDSQKSTQLEALDITDSVRQYYRKIYICNVQTPTFSLLATPTLASVGAQSPTTGEILASGRQGTPWPWFSSRDQSPHLPRGYLLTSGDIFSCHNLRMLLASNSQRPGVC